MLSDKKKELCTWLQVFIKDNVILRVLAIFSVLYCQAGKKTLLLLLYLIMQHIIGKIPLISSISSKGEYCKSKL